MTRFKKKHKKPSSPLISLKHFEGSEKNISVNLVYALNEASNKNIYDLYFKMFKSINKIMCYS